jgi:hypothetical protein
LGIFRTDGDIGERERGEHESESSEFFFGVTEIYLSFDVGDLVEYEGKLKDFVDIGERYRVANGIELDSVTSR